MTNKIYFIIFNFVNPITFDRFFYYRNKLKPENIRINFHPANLRIKIFYLWKREDVVKITLDQTNGMWILRLLIKSINNMILFII